MAISNLEHAAYVNANAAAYQGNPGGSSPRSQPARGMTNAEHAALVNAAEVDRKVAAGTASNAEHADFVRRNAGSITAAIQSDKDAEALAAMQRQKAEEKKRNFKIALIGLTAFALMWKTA